MIAGVGALLRFWDLGAVGYNNDEAVYAGQAAALAGDQARAQFFSIFRAHPLLIQFFISLVFRVQFSEFAGRAVLAAFGTATLVAAYLLGLVMFSKRTAVIGSLLLAVLPYHILISREVLLDVGLAFFYTITILFVVKYAKTGRLLWAYAFGASTALAILSKEAGIFLVPVVLLYLKARGMLKLRPLLVEIAAFIIAVAPGPLSLIIGGGAGETALVNVITWQIARPANHTWLFYPLVLYQYFDAVIVLAILGIVLAVARRTSADVMLLLWFSIPFMFFQIWPVKGFHYIVPLAPCLCLLAARLFEPPMTIPRLTFLPISSIQKIRVERLFAVFLTFLAVGSMLVTYASATAASQQVTNPTAGFSGFYGGRELGSWIRQNLPERTVFITIGVTMANLIEFYGERQAYALSVSPNPANRNPAYTPIRNPDYQIRIGQVHYLVWDTYSAARSKHFSDRLNSLVAKYNGHLVYIISAQVANPDGSKSSVDIIRVYEVFGAAGK